MGKTFQIPFIYFVFPLCIFILHSMRNKVFYISEEQCRRFCARLVRKTGSGNNIGRPSAAQICFSILVHLLRIYNTIGTKRYMIRILSSNLSNLFKLILHQRRGINEENDEKFKYVCKPESSRFYIILAIKTNNKNNKQKSSSSSNSSHHY